PLDAMNCHLAIATPSPMVKTHRFSLLSCGTGVMDVVTQRTLRKGDHMISTSEETPQAVTPANPKAKKKGSSGARRAPVAPKKGKSGKKASSGKKTPTARAKEKSTRDGSKASAILELLKRKDGATMQQLLAATEWQPHSVRGFLSGTVRKKMGLEI